MSRLYVLTILGNWGEQICQKGQAARPVRKGRAQGAGGTSCKNGQGKRGLKVALQAARPVRGVGGTAYKKGQGSRGRRHVL